MDVSIIRPVREAFPGWSIRPEVKENRAGRTSLGRLRARACSCLPSTLRRSGQPKVAAPDLCIRVASAPGEWSCVRGKPIAETGQLYFPAHSVGSGAPSASGRRASGWRPGAGSRRCRDVAMGETHEAQEPLSPLWHHLCRSFTAWMPQPSRWSCMAAASMSYERARLGGGRGSGVTVARQARREFGD
jgi:hypothetical protein